MEDFKLKEIVDRIWLKKKLILLTVAGSLFIAILYISLSTKEYTASLKVLPENQHANSGLLSQLGNIPGLNLGSQMGQENVLAPSLYPAIIQSNSFYLSLLDLEIETESDSSSVRDYVASQYSPSLLETVKKYTIGLPRLLRKTEVSNEKSRTEDEITYLSSNDSRFKGWLNKRISIVTESSTKILAISCESPHQLASAQIANFTAEYLKQYLDDYQTQNDVRRLEFIEERKGEANKEYLRTQHELAVFRDRNRNVLSEVSRTKEEVLMQHFNLTSRIYASLSEQYEQSNIKSKEKRVLFKVLEGVQLPASNTKPQVMLIIVVSLFTGILLSTLYVIFPIIFKEFYEEDSDGGPQVPI